MDWGQVFHDYVGPISALVGWIGNSLWQYVRKNYFGKLQFFFYNVRLGLSSYDSITKAKMGVETMDEAEEGELTFYVDIYNSKEIPIGLRNVKLIIGNNGLEHQLKGKGESFTTLQNMYVLNIQPNQFLKYILQTQLKKEQLNQIFKENVKIYFTATKQDGKKITEEVYINELREKYKNV